MATKLNLSTTHKAMKANICNYANLRIMLSDELNKHNAEIKALNTEIEEVSNKLDNEELSETARTILLTSHKALVDKKETSSNSFKEWRTEFNKKLSDAMTSIIGLDLQESLYKAYGESLKNGSKTEFNRLMKEWFMAIGVTKAENETAVAKMVNVMTTICNGAQSSADTKFKETLDFVSARTKSTFIKLLVNGICETYKKNKVLFFEDEENAWVVIDDWETYWTDRQKKLKALGISEKDARMKMASLYIAKQAEIIEEEKQKADTEEVEEETEE